MARDRMRPVRSELAEDEIALPGGGFAAIDDLDPMELTPAMIRKARPDVQPGLANEYNERWADDDAGYHPQMDVPAAPRAMSPEDRELADEGATRTGADIDADYARFLDEQDPVDRMFRTWADERRRGELADLDAGADRRAAPRAARPEPAEFTEQDRADVAIEAAPSVVWHAALDVRDAARRAAEAEQLRKLRR